MLRADLLGTCLAIALTSVPYKGAAFIILEIHKRYDLKGSTYKRTEKSSDPSMAKKDLDFLKTEKF